MVFCSFLKGQLVLGDGSHGKACVPAPIGTLLLPYICRYKNERLGWKAMLYGYMAVSKTLNSPNASVFKYSV